MSMNRVASLSALLAITLLPACGVLRSSKPSGGTQASDESTAAETSADQTDASAGTECKTPDGSSEVTSTYWPKAEPILKKHCVSCHTATTPDLSTADNAAANGAAVLAAVEAGRMPPGGGLTAEEIATLKLWADGGYPTLFLQAAAQTTWEGQIKSLITTKCAWCHSAAAQADVRETPYLTTYAAVVQRSEAIIEEMDQANMPPSGELPELGAQDLNMFQEWLAAGHPMGTPPPPVDTTNGVFYVDTIKTLLAQNCVGCHQAGVTSPDLSNYDAAKASGSLALAAIQSGTMPPSGPTTQVDKDLFQTWSEAGFPLSADGTGDTSGGTTPAPAPATDPASTTNQTDCPI